MKTTHRLIIAVILAILLIGLPVLIGFEPQATVSGQDGDENDSLVKIEGLDQEPPVEIDDANIHATYYVGGGTRCYKTIQDALDVANDGDTILLQGGRTFSEFGLVIEKDVIIEGGQEICLGTSTDPTTIDAGGSSFVLQASSATVTLRNLIITGGYSSNGGGLSAVSLSTVTLDNTKVNNNQATYSGGGIFIGVGSTVTLTNDSDITYNTATNSGGGVRVWGKLIANDGKSSVSHNQAPYGAGLSVPGGEVDFSGSQIADNQASAFGGGIHVYDEGVVKVGWSSNILRNSAISSGAGIFVENSTIELDGAVIHSNTASSAGGGIYLGENSVLTANNTYIGYIFSDPNLGKNAAAVGAGLYVDIGSTVSFKGQIVNNHASSDGGGLYMKSTSGTVDISNSLIKGNTSGRDGGAALVDGGSLNLIGPLTLEANTAVRYGGAIAVQNSGLVSIQSSGGKIEIFDNQAADSGGALYLHNTSTFKLYAANSYPLEIHDNSAAVLGGAAFADSSGFFDVYGQVLIHTNSAVDGGAFYLIGGSKIWLDDYMTTAPQLYNNRAYSGGAIYAANSPRVEFDGAIIGSELAGNRATNGHGGAIYLYNSVMSAENTQFFNNTATDHGGAIYANVSSLTINVNHGSATLTTKAEGRSEPMDGSFIQATACNPFERECSAYLGNIADSNGDNLGSGGAIYLTDSAMDMKQTYLHDNMACYGGAIYQTGSTSWSTISNSLIHHNTVTLPSGAGIKMENGTFYLMHVTITDNNGGASFSGRATSVFNSIAWENGYVGFTLEPLIFSCNIDNGAAAGPVLNPLFVAPGDTRNYHLQPESPAVDSCATGSGVDLENRTRPIGARYDMGAYEFDKYLINLPLIVR